jgi:demethoxyubiquinone hydroxylase (CLK1/Coq7/Cat5 family)
MEEPMNLFAEHHESYESGDGRDDYLPEILACIFAAGFILGAFTALAGVVLW